MNKVATKSKYTIFDGNLTLSWSELESQIKELLMFSVQQLLDLENLERKGAENFGVVKNSSVIYQQNIYLSPLN